MLYWKHLLTLSTMKQYTAELWKQGAKICDILLCMGTYKEAQAMAKEIEEALGDGCEVVTDTDWYNYV